MDAHSVAFPDKQIRLAELGLAETILLRAISQGFSDWANCTENDPPSFRGLAFWAATVRSLREELAPFGWTRVEDGVSLVQNEAGDIAVMVASGDSGTGVATRQVATQRSRGPKTTEQVRINQGQLRLFSLGNEIELPADDVGRQVWMLLYHRDMVAREIRAELSLPIQMGDDARPNAWRERIILASIPFDDDVFVAAPDDDLLGPDIDIAIEKRA